MAASQSVYETYKNEFDYIGSIYAAENSFYEFVKQAWHVVEGVTPFKEGWHIKAVCEHLEAAFRRDILKLLMNVPPRCTKTTLTLVLFPAWVWLHAPHERFLTSSYSSPLSRGSSKACKDLILSEWYQERWGHLYQLSKDQKEKTNFANDKRGAYIATSTRGTVTGRGGTFLIADDPNNVVEAESVAHKKESIEWFDGAWSTRGNDPTRTVKIVMQQRVSKDDISGHILMNDEFNTWVKLILPMEFEIDRRAQTVVLPSTDGKVWQDPRTYEGELLWPEQMTEKAVKDLKNDLRTPTRIAGQMQQRPTAAEGDLIRRNWFQWWKQVYSPEIIQTIQSWDTALSESKSACYSACTTWGLFYDQKDQLNIILLSAYRGRIGYPELRDRAKKLYYDYRDDGHHPIEGGPDGRHKADYVLVESKSSGVSLLQDFSVAGIPAFGFNPDKHGDKIARVHVVSHLLESGRVWVAAKPPFYTALFGTAAEFVESCVSFPSERDYTDSMVQVLLRLLGGWLRNPSDEQYPDTSKYLNKRIY
jgi:phage terminase large subunit-like protein